MYLVGNADEWWGHYWKAFVTGKDKDRISISHRQLLLKNHSLFPVSEARWDNGALLWEQKGPIWENSTLALCQVSPCEIPLSPPHLALTSARPREGQLEGFKGPVHTQQPPWQPKAGVTWWVLAAAAREWDSRLLPKAPLASGSLWDVQCTSPLPHHPATPRSCLAGLWLPVSALQTVKQR